MLAEGLKRLGIQEAEPAEPSLCSHRGRTARTCGGLLGVSGSKDWVRAAARPRAVSGHGAQNSLLSPGGKPNAGDLTLWAAGVSNNGGGMDNREGLPRDRACWPGAGYHFLDSILGAAHPGCPPATPRVTVRGIQQMAFGVPNSRRAPCPTRSRWAASRLDHS